MEQKKTLDIGAAEAAAPQTPDVEAEAKAQVFADKEVAIAALEGDENPYNFSKLRKCELPLLDE
jgi:hypothetical protein